MKKDNLIEQYNQMFLESAEPTMEEQVRAHLKAEAERDPLFAEKLDFDKIPDCMRFINECAQQLLKGQSGDVPDEICYKMARDFFNDRLWEEEETQEEKPAEKPKKAKKEKKKPEPKEEKPVVITASADEVEEPVAEEKPAPVKASPAAFNVNQLDLFGFGV